jgi:type II restriction/modification system DNA methylase subunit YeeA
MPTLTLPDFVNKWRNAGLTERAGAQMHFLELCDVLGEPHPASEDFTGATYTFEKGGTTIEGKPGFADVWKRGCFGWEYKGKHKDLNVAYQQLLKYREDLENPPLLVVCDLERFEVHTNFTGTAKQVYRFSLDDLLKNQATADCKLPPLEVLRAVFTDPARLRPDRSAADVTEMAAAEFATLADSLRARGVDPQRAAHFLMRLLFCLFAEDIGLLPPKLFSVLLERTRHRPAEFKARLAQLFAAMATGGAFGADDIAHFNGDLFTDAEVFDLSAEDIETLLRVSKLDWSAIEPAIFGTLFERSLDPGKRSQLGAHYTSRDDIMLIVEPVLMAPLRRRWVEVKAKADKILEKPKPGKAAGKKLQAALRNLLLGFVDELSHVRVLDPACGSGNFLYVALKLLLDLWKEVSVFGATHGLPHLLPYQVNPAQLYGIEINVYAQELASVVVWIGYIQWLHDNGFGVPPPPILQRLHNIRRMDAVLAHDAQGNPVEPEWPEVEVITGNPPFLGGKRLRTGLGDAYVEALFHLYESRVPPEADLVTYWFEKARGLLESKTAKRVGLLATQSIRAGANLKVLQRIKESGDIFMAWGDRPWVLDGAAVRVSMIGFDDGSERGRLLNGVPVRNINADLSAALDLSGARPLPENREIAFQGPVKVGPFDINNQTAKAMLVAPNPNGRPNSDVIKPTINGSDIARRGRQEWTIDFGELDEQSAALYEAPFEYVKANVKPIREKNRDRQRREAWWRLGRSGGDLKNAKSGKQRIVLTPRVAKHRLFTWAEAEAVPDTRVYAFARDDDYFFGVLQSNVHEIWSLKTCSWHGVGNDPTYNTSTCFDPFPFPWPPGKELKDDPRVRAIAAAAKKLVEKRDAWLNPPGASAAELKKRTLTNLYNQRPQWLEDVHRALDKAVLAAYGWPEDLSDTDILERLLALNRERAGACSVGS